MQRRLRAPRFAACLALSLLGAGALLSPADARAHFVLEDPPASTDQDSLGNPQKAPPCGGGADNGILSAFAEGQTITITVDETIFHPGHYRVALGMNGAADLPEDPPVTAGDTDCGSTTIQTPPVFPVLADGELVHTSSFNGPMSFTVTLPAGVTCDHCTLQVIQFMSDHALNVPGGCFYHHCATVSIGTQTPTSVTTAGPSSNAAAGSTSATSGAGAGSGTGSGGDGSGGESGGCAIGTGGDAPAEAPLIAALVLGGGAIAARRRRRG